MSDSDGLFFVGNATTIIRYGGFTLLTDPNFLRRGQRARLGWGLSTRRLRDPALSIDELPEVDAVVLSHLHGDHWDRVASRNLDRELPIVTTRSAAWRLRLRGFRRTRGLLRWQRHELIKGSRTVRVTSLPARHAPGAAQALLPPVMGSMLEFGPTGGGVDLRVYISGDTLMYPELREIPRRFPDIDVGVVHLGGTTLLGRLMVTMDGVQGADWMELTGPRRVIPVHTDDYAAFRSPLADFEREARRRGLTDKVHVVERGTTTPILEHADRSPS